MHTHNSKGNGTSLESWMVPGVLPALLPFLQPTSGEYPIQPVCSPRPYRSFFVHHVTVIAPSRTIIRHRLYHANELITVGIESQTGTLKVTPTLPPTTAIGGTEGLAPVYGTHSRNLAKNNNP